MNLVPTQMSPRPDRARRARSARVAAAGVALLGFGSLGFALLSPSGASAQNPVECESAVIDSSGRIDASAVRIAIDQIDLDRIGPDAFVAVRVWGEVPGADLVGAVDDVVATCWGDPDGGIEDDVAVIGLAVDDGLSDVLLGAGWGLAVPDADRLRGDVMGPLLAEGDLTGGLVAAIDEMAAGAALLDDDGGAEGDDGGVIGSDAVSDETDPGSDDTVTDEVTGSDGDTDDTDDTDTDTDDPDDDPGVEIDNDAGSSPWTVAFGAVGLVGCGGAVVLVRRRRRLAAERDRLRRRVQPSLGRLHLVRERHRRVLEQADLWSMTSAGRTKTELIAAVRGVESAARESDRAKGLLDQALPNGIDGASHEEAERGGERAAVLSRTLDVQAEAIDELGALGAHLDHLEVAMPVKVDVLATEIPEAGELADLRASEGWPIGDARTELSSIQAAVAEVRDADSVMEVDLLALSDELEEAEARLFALDHRLESLPEREPSIRRWDLQLAEAADHELHRVDQIRRQLASVAIVHAADSWRWAADHPDQAVEALERSDEQRHRATEELLAAQRFDEAGELLDVAGLELIRADGLLDEVDDLLVDLERSRAEAPGVLDQLDAEYRALVAGIDRHRSDLTPALFSRRGQLGPVVAALRAELGRAKPNHLEIVESAEEVGRQIEGLLAEVDEQYQRAEALRGELHRQRARATRALARARRSLGWQLFPSGDGAALDRLEAGLATLPDDLSAAVVAATDIADAALRIQEQIIARRRRRGVSVPVGAGSSIGSGRSQRSSRRSSRSRSSGGRSFGGRSRSRGGRRTGSRRSSGRF